MPPSPKAKKKTILQGSFKWLDSLKNPVSSMSVSSEGLDKISEHFEETVEKVIPSITIWKDSKISNFVKQNTNRPSFKSQMFGLNPHNLMRKF